MKFSTTAVAAVILTIGGASAFSTAGRRAFAVSRTPVTNSVVSFTGGHYSGCNCNSCAGSSAALFSAVEESAEATEDDAVPAEVEAMDGVESDQEAHNVDRPARQQLKKKRAPKGKPLTEFEAGTTVSGKVRSVASYGAFVDIGAASDGLLHISQLASGYVASVGDIVKEGQELEVRILTIDTDKNQIALSLISEEEAKNQGQRQRPQRQNRRNDSAAIAGLVEKGWDDNTFVEGTVVSTIDFGAFIRIDASTLNSEVEGEIDGLCHISSLSEERIRDVTDVVNVDDKVQIRLKSIDGKKVSLTILSKEQEGAKSQARNDRTVEVQGAADWADQLAIIKSDMPEFKNNIVFDPKK